MSNHLSRRQLLRNTSLAGLAVWTSGRIGLGAENSPGERLRLAVVGLGNQSRADVPAAAKYADVVAACDIDRSCRDRFAKQHPKARLFADFRKMYDKTADRFDAVMVITPNHTHATVALPAMRLGKHVYCEKPLTHTILEARAMARVAKEMGVVTQMGTQIHAGANYRRVVELVRSGAIGDVRKVHVWFGKPGGFRRYKTMVDPPTERPPVPEGVDWDLWIGPAPMRPYHPCYHPHDWHYWWDFGNGTLGNMSPHFQDVVFWALGLGSPTSIEAAGPPVNPQSTPFWLDCTWQYPARGDMPPVTVVWHHGRNCPKEVTELSGVTNSAGVLFVGERGMLFCDYGNRKLLPKQQYADYKPPRPTIPDSIGCHRREWIEACRGNGRALCHFDYASKLTEAILLGNIAYRVGGKLEWDGDRMTFPNSPEANRYLHYEYREGWKL